MKNKLEDIGNCRGCGAPLIHRFVDELLTEPSIAANQVEVYATYVCAHCFLVQRAHEGLPARQEHIFLSSFSYSWLSDMKKYEDQIFSKLETTGRGLIVELIKHEPDRETHRNKDHFYFGRDGLHSIINLYGKAVFLECGQEMSQANDIQDFVSGIKLFLKSDGIVALEFLYLFPYLVSGTGNRPIPQVSHLFSFTTVDILLRMHNLEIYEVEHLSAKGLLRMRAKHANDTTKVIAASVPILRGIERDAGMSSITFYMDFRDRLAMQEKPAYDAKS